MTQQSYKVCPRCQTPAALDAPSCAQCGRQFRTQFVQHETTQVIGVTAPMQAAPPVSQQLRPLAHASQPSVLCCPACGYEQVQKVSAVVHAGTITTQSTGVSVGAGHVFGGGPNFGTVGISKNQSIGQSEMVKMLSAPSHPFHPKKNASGCPLAVMLFFGIPMLLGGLISLFSNALQDAIPGIILGGGLCIGAFFVWRSGDVEYRRLLHIYHQSVPVWQYAIDRWNLLFYCTRCSVVFHAQDRTAASPQQMNSLLYP